MGLNSVGKNGILVVYFLFIQDGIVLEIFEVVLICGTTWAHLKQNNTYSEYLNVDWFLSLYICLCSNEPTACYMCNFPNTWLDQTPEYHTMFYEHSKVNRPLISDKHCCRVPVSTSRTSLLYTTTVAAETRGVNPRIKPAGCQSTSHPVQCVHHPAIRINVTVCYPTHVNCYPTHVNCYPTQVNRYPTHVNCYPTHVNRYPTHVNRYPTHVNCYPTHVNCYPKQVNCYPTHVNRYPTHVNCYPTHVNRYPTHVNRYPTHVNCYPTHVNCYPTHVNRYPTHVDCYPTQVNSYPTHVNRYPTHVNRYTTHVNCYPTQVNRYPTHVNCYPTQVNRYPTQVNCYPTQINRYPTHVNRYPTHVNCYPTHVNCYPTQVNRYPTHVNRYTTHVNCYPTQVNRYPTQVNCYPTQINRYPTHVNLKSRSAEVEYALKTNITTENEETYSKVMLEEDAFRREWATNASRFTKVNSSDYIRQLYFIKDIGEQWQTDTSKSKEMNDLLNKMSSIYAKGKICLNNKPCMAMEPDIHDLMASSTDYDELLEAWIAWRDATGRKMKPLYKRFVELYNEAIRLSGHKDAGEYWRSWYETPTFEEDLQNLLNQVRPLYELLHAYVRMRLKDIYPKDKFPASGHIPAHLLGDLGLRSGLP
ncbi:hypothetical protein Btru_007072 [Bulinus truncatus]|nr:hypothetical protein Btru_007072 [Bulinus truncatus]